MNRKKTGLFGGTFNPPHIGHLLIVKKIKKEFNLDKIIFIPAYCPPHKKMDNIISSEHRLNMVKLLIMDEPSLVVSEFEIKKNMVSYTIDTVKYFINEFFEEDLFFIIGSDNFNYIETWKDYKNLLNIINFIIYLRNGFSQERLLEKHKTIINQKIFWSKSELINISSSEIREKIRNGENCIEDIGEKVWNYIVKNNLYK